MDKKDIDVYASLLVIKAMGVAYKELKANDVNEIEYGQVGKSLRWQILKRDTFKCVYCGRSSDDGVKLHIDHILPTSKGGKDTKNNLVTSCEPCNLSKSSEIMSDELLKDIQSQVKKRNESNTVNT